MEGDLLFQNYQHEPRKSKHAVELVKNSVYCRQVTIPRPPRLGALCVVEYADPKWVEIVPGILFKRGWNLCYQR